MNKSTKILAAIGLATVPVAGTHAFGKIKGQFLHHVLFWLNEPENPEAVAKFEEGVQKLLKLKNIQSFHFGKPAQTPREVVDNSYHYSYVVTFDSKASHEKYQEDPDHKKFVEDYGHLWDRVLIYDSIQL